MVEVVDRQICFRLADAAPAAPPPCPLRLRDAHAEALPELSRRIAAELVRKTVIGTVAERTRLGLVGVLVRRGAAFERLGIDAERLFVRLGRVPDSLFA